MQTVKIYALFYQFHGQIARPVYGPISSNFGEIRGLNMRCSIKLQKITKT